MSESDPFAFLEGNEPEAVTAETEAQASAPETAQQEPEPQPEPEPASQAAPEPTPEPPVQREAPDVVPVSALLEERRKRQELERQLAEQNSAANAVATANAYQDPYAYTEAVAQQLAQQLEAQRYQISQMNAVARYGADDVEKARVWAFERCGADPLFDAKVSQAPDPYTVVVEEYRREQVLAQFKPDEMQQFLAWRAAQQAGGQQPAPVAAPAAAPTKPAMTSLKTVAMAGGVKPTVKPAPVSEQETFDQMFS